MTTSTTVDVPTTRRTLDRPRTVGIATLLWAGAVLAGVVESAMGIAGLVSEGRFDAGVLPQIVVRMAVYAVATAVIVWFAQGRAWTRITLTGGLTVVGLGTLVVPAAGALADGQGLVVALGGSLGWPFAVVRLAHIVCVVAASVLMFTPTANAYFRRGRRRLDRTVR